MEESYYQRNRTHILETSYFKRYGKKRPTIKDRTKNCVVCSDLFVGKNTRQVSCSKECNKIKQKGWKPKKIKKYQSNIIARRYHEYKLGASRRNHRFNLSIIIFSSFWKKNCYYCGRKIKTIGLDRVDNTKGYIFSNVVPCCKECNNTKGTLSILEFKQHIKKQRKFFINKLKYLNSINI